MGDRINFAFKDREGHAVILYSHWGATGWQHDIAAALEHARPRWDDSAYGTRMMISYLIQDSILDETGYGIYAVTDTSCLNGSYDQVIVIDFADKTVNDGPVSVEWDKFITAYFAGAPAT
jgi:hypothetical protein